MISSRNYSITNADFLSSGVCPVNPGSSPTPSPQPWGAQQLVGRHSTWQLALRATHVGVAGRGSAAEPASRHKH